MKTLLDFYDKNLLAISVTFLSSVANIQDATIHLLASCARAMLTHRYRRFITTRVIP
jgi:hypothetical protein